MAQTHSILAFVTVFVLVGRVMFDTNTVAQCGADEATLPPIETVHPKELSTADIQRIRHNKDWVVVDTRLTDAYNGWALDGVRRGGHLPGAVDFAANWLNAEFKNLDNYADRIAAALHDKGIERSKHVVLYDASGYDTPGSDTSGSDTSGATHQRVTDYLRQLGFEHLYYYDLRGWADNDDLPLVRYENYQLLVPAAVVQRLLDSSRRDADWPETFTDATNIKFAEVSWGPEAKSYVQGHVPGSFHIDTDDFEPPPKWMLGDKDVLSRFAAKYGICASDTMILSGADPTACYRLAIVLRYMGVRDVRVLNGGIAAWKAAGYDVETKRNPPSSSQSLVSSQSPESSQSFGGPIPSRPTLIDVHKNVIAGLQNSQHFTLVDNRTWNEYIGETSGYQYHHRKGRIPGSAYGQASYVGDNALDPYRNIDNTMRNGDEILALWKDSGIDTSKHLSFMCGSGWRAAEVLTFAQVIGIEHASLYSDGWIGWSNDPRNPIEVGDPQSPH